MESDNGSNSFKLFVHDLGTATNPSRFIIVEMLKTKTAIKPYIFK